MIAKPHHSLYKLCILFIAQYIAFPVVAQDSLTKKLAYIAVEMDRPAMKLGQQMPDVNLDKIVHYKPGKTPISYFHGKLLILDFWHQWCTTCLEGFSKLDSLQKAFGDRIVILPVTFQSEKSVNDFYLSRARLGRQMNLPSVVEDTLLRKMFPHNGDPHEVWIDATGKIIGITEAQAVTRENITKALNGAVLNMEVKNYSLDFNPFQPFLVNGNGGPDSFFEYRSMITGYLDSVASSGFQRQSDAKMTRLFLANVPIADLYQQAYNNVNTNPAAVPEQDLLYKRIVFETRDTSRYLYWDQIANLDYDAYLRFKRSHLYCYELIVPPDRSIRQACEMMVQDLDRFFQTKSSIEKREIRHLSLLRKPIPDKLRSAGGKRELFISPDNLHIRLVNCPLSDLIGFINDRYTMPVIIDETLYSGNVDISLDFNKTPDIPALQSQLEKYGLSIAEMNTAIDMLILHDNRMDDEKKQPVLH